MQHNKLEVSSVGKEGKLTYMQCEVQNMNFATLFALPNSGRWHSKSTA